MRSQEGGVEAIYARRPAWVKGSISRSDARFLYGRVLQATDDAIVEIGTRELLSADQLAHIRFRHPATALDVADDYPEDSLGFVFVDAAHKHPWPCLDLLAVLASLRPGAEVVFHDINLPLINPDWQAWGVKYLFDELEVEKHTDPESETPNIGSVIVPDDKEPLRRQVLATIAAHDYEAEVPQQTLSALLPDGGRSGKF